MRLAPLVLVLSACSMSDDVHAVPDRPVPTRESICAAATMHLQGIRDELVDLSSKLDLAGEPYGAQVAEDAAAVLSVDVCDRP